MNIYEFIESVRFAEEYWVFFLVCLYIVWLAKP